MQLRDYQERALANLSNAFRAGRRAPLLVAPTGAGKTAMAGTMCARHLQRSPTNRVVWLAHRTELIDQARETLNRLGCNLERCAVTSIQSALSGRELPPATFVVQDEAHHQASDEWSKLNTAWPKAFRVGLSATPERGDGRGLRVAFDDIIVAATPSELTEWGFLVPCRVARPGKLLRSKHVAQRPVDAYLADAPGRQAVVFCQHVTAAQAHLEEFRAAGIPAALVTAETPWSERQATIQAFREGRGRVLLNVYVLTEGFDAPETSCVIIARGCGTSGMYLQMIGRGLRPAPGKEDCILLDLRGVSWVHGNPLEDRVYSLDGKGIRLKSEVVARFCVVCGAVLSGEPACPGCGRRPEELEPPKVTGDALEKVDKWATMPEDRRIGQLAYWLRSARAAGHHPYAPFKKYESVFKQKPSDAIRRAAERMAR